MPKLELAGRAPQIPIGLVCGESCNNRTSKVSNRSLQLAVGNPFLLLSWYDVSPPENLYILTLYKNRM